MCNEVVCFETIRNNTALKREELGFDYVGCELDKDIFESSNRRLQIYKRQIKLL